jgi:hypothetical protein
VKGPFWRDNISLPTFTTAISNFYIYITTTTTTGVVTMSLEFFTSFTANNGRKDISQQDN